MGASLHLTGDPAHLVTALEDRRARLPFESRPGRQSGFGHSGTYGQYLMVFPDYQLVVVRLVDLQVLDRPDALRRARRQQEHTVDIEARRGRILDRAGRPLAERKV